MLVISLFSLGPEKNQNMTNCRYYLLQNITIFRKINVYSKIAMSFTERKMLVRYMLIEFFYFLPLVMTSMGYYNSSIYVK